MTTPRANRYQASSPRVGGAMMGRSAGHERPVPAASFLCSTEACLGRQQQHQLDDFFDGAFGRVDDDSVGRDSGACSAGGVDVVATGNVCGHFVVVHVEHLLAAALSALLVAGGHIDLYWSFGEDDGPDVPALDDAGTLSLRPIRAGD